MDVTLTVESNIASLFRQALEIQFPHRDRDSLCLDAAGHRATVGFESVLQQDLRIELRIDDNQLNCACFDKKYRISLSSLCKNHFSVSRKSFCRFGFGDSVEGALIDSNHGLAHMHGCKVDLLKLGKPTVKLKANNLHLEPFDRLMVNSQMVHCSFMQHRRWGHF